MGWLAKLQFWRKSPRQPAVVSIEPPEPAPAMPASPIFQALEASAPLRVNTLSGEVVQHGILCRETILNRDQRVAGYEFMLRDSVRARLPHTTAAVAKLYDEALLTHLLLMDLPRLLGQRLAYARMGAATLLEIKADRLQHPNLTLIVEPVALDAGQLAHLTELCKRGLMLGLDNPHPEQHSDWLGLADSVWVDWRRTPPHEFVQLAQTLYQKWPEVWLNVRGLESNEDFDACYRLVWGTYCVRQFEGDFVSSRANWHQPRMDASKNHVLQVMNLIRQGAENAEVAKLLQQDSAMLFKLLRFINSPASGLSQRIESLEQALLLMGREKLYRWLVVLLFTTGETRPRDWALLDQALSRARFMELLLPSHAAKNLVEQHFLTGMLSMMDLLMQQPLADVLQELKLPEDVRSALLQQQGPIAPYLQLAQACEGQSVVEIHTLAAQLDLEPGTINTRHLEAVVWAQSVDM